MYTSMKTISLDHPVRVYFKDGECHHDSATILIANGFPSFVRGKNPDVIYPWENVNHIIRAAEDVATAVTAAEVERLQAEVDRLKQLHHDSCVSLRDALGLTHDNHDHAGLCDQVARILAEWDHLRRYTSPGSLARLERDLEDSRTLHHEHRMALRAALSLRDDEATDNVTGDFKALCERVSSQRKSYESAYRTAHINSDDAHRLSNDVANIEADLASVTEQRDVLKRQLEELRADMRKPALPQPVEPGGPIWVRVVDTTSKHFGLAGRLEGISFRGNDEVWSVDLGGISPVHRQANMFAVVGTGRQGIPEEAKSEPHNHGVLSQSLDQKAKSFRENNPPDAEHQPQYHGNGESLRAVATAAGATDCSVFVDDGQVTLVVGNLRHGKTLQHVANVVFDLVPILDTKTYVVRTAGPIGERREVRSTPESRSRTPRP